MPNDYGSSPFKNKQAAKSDRYGNLTSARDKLVSDYNKLQSTGKPTAQSAKEYKSQLNKLDQARMQANPEAFKADINAARGPESERVQVMKGGTLTSFKEMSGDNYTGSKRRGGN